MPGDTEWTTERTEVLKELALLNQAMLNLSADFTELRVYLTGIISDLKKKDETRQQEIIELKLKVGNRMCDDHEADLNKIKDDMTWIRPAVKIIMWVGTALGLSIIALIWSIITHAVTIVR
jgi:hypothetical protein